MTDRAEIAPWDTWTWDDVPVGMSAAALADEVERSTADLLVSIAPLSEEALAAPGTFDRWSGHDLFAHCLAWAEICAKVIREIVSGTLNLDDYRHLPTYDESEEALNQRQIEDLRDTSVDEMVQRLERARDEAADALRHLEGQPPAMLVHMTFGLHFDDHAGAFARATEV
jgi:hypothetical protein